MLFQFIALFTFSHTAALESTTGCVILMEWSGSTFMWLSGTLKNSRKISSLLNIMAICVCKVCGSGFGVLERQRAFLEDRCHHTVVWERFCRTEFTFQASHYLRKPKSFFATPQHKTATFTANPTPYSFELHYSNRCQQSFIQPTCLLVIDIGLGYSAYSSSFIHLCTNLHAQH